MKKLTLSITALLLAVMLCACGGGEGGGEKALKLEGNLWKLTTAEDFNKGTLENVVVDETVGNGAIKLADGATEGTFTSAEYEVIDFEYLVASWNAAIEGNSSVEIMARAYIVSHKEGEARDGWTNYLSWGEFGPEIRRACKDGNEDAEGHGDKGWAYMNQDTFCIRGVHGATKVQFKAILKKGDNGTSPVLRQISGTTKNSNKGREITPTYAETPYEGTLPNSVHLKAPAYAQSIRDPDIGGSMCNPTTMSMMLNARGEDLLPEELAMITLDYDGGVAFGSWSYVTSVAGLYGYEAYAQYGSVDILMQELAKGNTMGISVRYSTKPGDKYYLEGAYGDTSGHLISIIGYEYEAGHEGDMDYLYFISGDSYSPSDANSFHRYKWAHLQKAWANPVCYVVSAQKEVTGTVGTERFDATLEKQDDGTYALMADGKQVDLTGFCASKKSKFGAGVIGYTVEGVKTDVSKDLQDRKYSINYDNALQVTANDTWFDLSCVSKTIALDLDQLLANAEVKSGETRTMTFYFACSNGKMYIAKLEATKA